MASEEVLVLRVDNSTSTGGECLCTGENRVAKRRRKERAASSLTDVSIVGVENGKPEKKARSKPTNSKTQGAGFPAISIGDSDDVEIVEIAATGTTTNAKTHSGPSSILYSGSSGGGGASGSSSGAGVSVSTSGATGDPLASHTQIDTDYVTALKLDVALNSVPSTVSVGSCDLDKDRLLAKSLQEKEYNRFLHQKSTTSSTSTSASPFVPSDEYIHSPGSSLLSEHVKEPTVARSKKTSSKRQNPLQGTYPKCWTECPRCPPDVVRKYHLIDVVQDSAEWGVIAEPIAKSGFTVTKVQRIQNEMFWQRLCFEKQLMLRERSDVNERFLYHTSRSSTSVICEEGLDQRLSASHGNFGSGIYFRYVFLTTITRCISLSMVKGRQCSAGKGGGGGGGSGNYFVCCHSKQERVDIRAMNWCTVLLTCLQR